MSDGINNQQVGHEAEERAAGFLQEQGCSILERNYRYSRYGEIDIIARKDHMLLFVEVRCKRRHQHISAMESVTPAKITRLKKAATAYIRSHKPLSSEETSRFDLITVEDGEMTWIRDIVR